MEKFKNEEIKNEDNNKQSGALSKIHFYCVLTENEENLQVYGILNGLFPKWKKIF